ncbi:hypothetical protein AAC387_Pa04g0633 [Persea americana]
MSSILSLSAHFLFCFFFSLSFPTFSISVSTSPSYQTFIILVDSHSKPSPFQSHKHWYSSFISPSSPSPFIHIYNTLFHGFSASLTPHQSKHLKKSHGILAVYPDSTLHIHTTRSPSFLGLDRPTSPLTNLSDDGSDTIIGFLDTGVWPERRSFEDRNIGPIPTRWRGQCEEGQGFIGSSCNRKLIGARFFSGGYDASPVGPINDTVEFRSPRDSNGHGTHVASVAAGSRVGGAGFRGFAKGVARGMAPKARIAIYKVCWKSGCLLSDMCKALEKAVSDGVPNGRPRSGFGGKRRTRSGYDSEFPSVDPGRWCWNHRSRFSRVHRPWQWSKSQRSLTGSRDRVDSADSEPPLALLCGQNLLFIERFLARVRTRESRALHG